MCRMLSSEGISRLVLGSGTGFQRAHYRASAEVHKAKQQLSTLFVCLYLVFFKWGTQLVCNVASNLDNRLRVVWSSVTLKT